MDGFQRFFGFQPNTRAAVLVFGLFHGFGLATKLQEFALSPNGLVANIVSFNVGVEIGQVLALTAILIGADLLAHAQRLPAPRVRHQRVVMACGFLLVGYQLSGYFLRVAMTDDHTMTRPATDGSRQRHRRGRRRGAARGRADSRHGHPAGGIRRRSARARARGSGCWTRR